MRIVDLMTAGRPSVSFEIFPPKRLPPSLFGDAEQQEAMERTKRVVEEIAAVKPSFISVTYGAAGGTTGANTAEIAAWVQHCGIPALAHLTCLTSSREKIADEVRTLRGRGIENILCLRGDRPPDAAGTDAAGPSDFRYAADLVRALRPSNFCLGAACYPEKHTESVSLAADIAHLKEKVEAGVDFLTTQMFFDNNVYFHYLARLRDAGITVPVVAGIMPVTNVRQIERILSLSGTVLPPRFRAIVERFGDDPESMLAAGVAYATSQIVDLFANGINNVHVYTMNKPEVASRIMRNLDPIVHPGGGSR